MFSPSLRAKIEEKLDQVAKRYFLNFNIAYNIMRF